MHSTQYTAAAQMADNDLFGSIVASADLPYAYGTRPSAWVIVGRDEHPDRGYSVHQVVFPETDAPYSMYGTYDLTRERAFEIWAQKVARDCSVAHEPVPSDLALNGFPWATAHGR